MKKPPIATPMRPRRAPSEETRRFNEALNITGAEEDRRAFLATRNPIYLWRAIEAFRVVNGDARRAGEHPLPLPKWIIDELGVVARRIMDIAEGKDWREAPKPFGLLSADSDALQRGRARKPSFDKDRAANDVLHALGFRAAGTNAFTQFWSRNAEVLDALSVDLYRGRLRGPDKAPVEHLARLERLDDGTITAVPVKRATEGEAIEMVRADTLVTADGTRRRRRKVLSDEKREAAGVEAGAYEATATRRRVSRGRRAT